MRNATIATSRTRATTDQLIDYRPLPAAWGDLEALHAVRAEKSRAADQGRDPSTLQLPAPHENPTRRSAGRRSGRAPLAALLRARGTHRRGRDGGLVTA